MPVRYDAEKFADIERIRLLNDIRHDIVKDTQ